MKAVAVKVPPASRIANKAEVAEFFEVHIATLDAWLRRSCPYRQRGGRGRSWEFDLLEVAKWRLGVTDQEETHDNPEEMAPKDRKDWYDGEEKRLRVAERKSELIPADEVRKTMADVLKVLALTMDTLPDVIERDAGLSEGQVEVLQSIVRRERENIYMRLTGSAK